MSLPEISQRCLSCGASVRAGARFCTQCGAQMGVDALPVAHNDGAVDGQPPETELAAAETAAEGEDDLRFEEEWKKFEASSIRHPGMETKHTDMPGSVVAGSGSSSVPLTEPVGEALPRVASASTAETEASTRANDTGATRVHATQNLVAESNEGDSASEMTKNMETGASLKGGRASTTAAAVRDSVRPRVERVRAASSVVFEEASEDSGLRFVLIAGLLFLLFLFFLLLSTILK